jgi:hypothetical protein
LVGQLTNANAAAVRAATITLSRMSVRNFVLPGAGVRRNEEMEIA